MSNDLLRYLDRSQKITETLKGLEQDDKAKQREHAKPGEAILRADNSALSINNAHPSTTLWCFSLAYLKYLRYAISNTTSLLLLHSLSPLIATNGLNSIVPASEQFTLPLQKLNYP